ncbi:hypothetical protein [Parapedobacter sp. 2B3]|uniref:hypothetical protein n=1 Tax=Parapedobacter sp. 2B3 TaxID=3342381 RepID=UPI0035B5F456
MENVNYKELYHRALADPAAVDDDTLSTLIDRFPYAQALHMAQARKSYLQDGPSDMGNPLLVTGMPSWLYGYLLADGQPNDGALPTEHTTDPAAPAATNAAEEPAATVIDIETVIPDMDDPGVMEHPVSMDYFAYEKKGDGETAANEGGISQEIVPIAEATPHEKLSLYNDEHLPYSFLWWLNKTRMEHAGTYRPYAPGDDTTVYPAGAVGTADDERVLDHQIRENIFHLQSPEEKLSTAQPAETVPFQVPKKTDPMIERFIREEPQIKPPQADKINLENKARKSAEDQLTLVTETLANIYVEQGLYPKAIAIYKKLSLKYPEKSAYFAARITELTNKLP